MELGEPLFEEGRYAEAADMGLELIKARQDQPYLYQAWGLDTSTLDRVSVWRCPSTGQ